MKLRIKGNSIRLRITQGELERLAEIGHIEETVPFAPGRKLVYGLQVSEAAEVLTAHYEKDMVSVELPMGWLEPWAEMDRVGFEGVQPAGEGKELHLLIEKDFDCLHKRPEDTDTFPNPLADA